MKRNLIVETKMLSC